VKLVIGANGYLGSHVTRQLVVAGRDVRIMVRPNASTVGIDDLKVERLTGDIWDNDTRRDAMTAMHAANPLRRFVFTSSYRQQPRAKPAIRSHPRNTVALSPRGWGVDGVQILTADEARERVNVDDVVLGSFNPHCARIQPAKLAREARGRTTTSPVAALAAITGRP